MELDVEYFRPKKPELAPIEGADSTDAPARPKALDAVDADQFQTLETTDAPLKGELILPEQSVPLPTINQFTAPYFRINFASIESRSQLLAELHATIPLNEFNLPAYFYRSDLLDAGRITELAQLGRLGSTTKSSPEHGDAEESVSDLIEAARVNLNYHDGYPTLKNGSPFWARMEHESAEAFGAFITYLEIPGARTFSDPLMKAYEPGMVQEFYHAYCWSFRTRAFDMFKMTHHQRMRIHRIMSTENNHYLESEKLFSKITQAIQNKTPEDWEATDLDKLVNMLEKVTKIQRVSAGLPAMGAPDDSKNPTPVSVEVSMRQIAKQSGETQKVDEGDNTFALLQDPDALAVAQELIVRVDRR